MSTIWQEYFSRADTGGGPTPKGRATTRSSAAVQQLERATRNRRGDDLDCTTGGRALADLGRPPLRRPQRHPHRLGNHRRPRPSSEHLKTSRPRRRLGRPSTPPRGLGRVEPTRHRTRAPRHPHGDRLPRRAGRSHRHRDRRRVSGEAPIAHARHRALDEVAAASAAPAIRRAIRSDQGKGLDPSGPAPAAPGAGAPGAHRALHAAAWSIGATTSSTSPS